MSDAPGKVEEATPEPGKKGLPNFLKRIRIPTAFITAVTLAFIGYLGDRALKRHDKANLYAQLIAQREASANALRMDMFNSMISMFFQQRKSEGELKTMRDDQKADYWRNFFSKRLLQLEMLAVNFGEAMSMGPLFHELVMEINDAEKEGEIDFVAREQDLERLEQLATRVSSWQLATLPQNNQVIQSIRWRVPKNDQGARYNWPGDLNRKNLDRDPKDTLFKKIEAAKAQNDVSSIPSSGDRAPKSMSTETDETIRQKRAQTRKEVSQRINNSQKFSPGKNVRVDIAKNYREIEYDKVTRYIKVALSDVDKPLKKVRATVTIKEGSQLAKAESFDFDLDFFHFPMIDNIRLSHGHRLALVLKKLDAGKRPNLEVTLVIFPGTYGDQRDKPFLDVVMQQLP